MIATGLFDRSIDDTPWAVLDFETTGLYAGDDRVVEVAIVRVEPDGSMRLVLDSLVNPGRGVGATKIHGITDEDVSDAPTFADLSGEICHALDGCVVSAYNAAFDMPFLRHELRCAGIETQFAYACLMYLRPALKMGKQCRLAKACDEFCIELDHAHTAGADALASAKLLGVYRRRFRQLGLSSFGDLARHCSYRFTRSFNHDTFRFEDASDRGPCRAKSRRNSGD